MDVSEIEELVSTLINDAIDLDEVHVTFDGSQCRINAVSDMFDDLSRVKRQQAVLKPLAEIIKNGTVHAITVKTFSKAQWKRDKLFN
ncbi:BolA family protein [Colwellia psychrerythraea]|uniref:BolA family protein n=1 Tax=Colwellia psychrerythraea TaxID=28229 RepID=A0A099KNI2_COLPS|nr:BolA/IbaG family iron-sulfur metabolism protein [Colwellia psychrerythraea]KGJ92329.1 BolA family protein [Colwellia psychrerythraea]